MVIFVDLEDEDVEPPHHLQHDKLLWSSTTALLDRSRNQTQQHMRTPPPSPPLRPQTHTNTSSQPQAGPSIPNDVNKTHDKVEEAHEPDVAEIPNWNSMTEALGCYP